MIYLTPEAIAQFGKGEDALRQLLAGAAIRTPAESWQRAVSWETLGSDERDFSRVRRGELEVVAVYDYVTDVVIDGVYHDEILAVVEVHTRRCRRRGSKGGWAPAQQAWALDAGALQDARGRVQRHKDGPRRAHRLIQQIRARREELGLSQAQAADRAGILQPAWARTESGGRQPSLDVLERMAAAVELDVTLVPTNGQRPR